MLILTKNNCYNLPEKLFSPGDILAVMVKARGNSCQCDQSFILADKLGSPTRLAVMSHDRPPSD